MPIVPTTGTILPFPDLAVSLASYAQIIRYRECAFWGVRNEDDQEYECRSIWIKAERDDIAHHLAEAQHELEVEVKFPLAARWFADEDHPWAYPLRANWCRIIEAGVRAESNIELDAAINHATDPATITVTTTVTDESEIRVYYPASLGVEDDVEIDPSDIDIAGGTATIYVPRCRMVHPQFADNPREGLSYDNLANFLSVVDVKRVYNDPSTHATLVWPHSCTSASLCDCTCDEYTHDGCIYLRDAYLGLLDTLPASYSAGAWTRTTATCCGEPERVRVNYRAGLRYADDPGLWRKMQDAVVRLAHVKMAEPACACDDWLRVWRRDLKTPEIGLATRELINCPFGKTEGAWTAWRFAQASRIVRGGRPL